MLDRKEVRLRRHAESGLDDRFGLGDVRGEEVHRILRVQVIIDPMVSQSLQVGVASRCIVALGIRRAHVGGILADHIGDGSFVLDHLLLPHVRRKSHQAVVGPGMGGDLVTFVDHAPEQVGPGGRGIDFPFPQVVSRDKEGGGEAILLEEIQELRRVEVRTVIVCQGHHVRLGAAEDVVIVRDLAQARARIGEGRWSGGGGVGIAPTELKLAVWILAVGLFRATVPLHRLSPSCVGRLGQRNKLLGNYSIGPRDMSRRHWSCRTWPFPPGRYIARTGVGIQCHSSRRWSRKS